MLLTLLLGSSVIAIEAEPFRALGAMYTKADGSVGSPTTSGQPDYSIDSVPPPTVWNQTYGGPYEDMTYGVQQTSDGGYIACGYTRSLDVEGYADGWLVKTDTAGSLQWNKTYGGPWDDEIYCIQKTSDGGYIACGYTCIAPSGGPGDDYFSDFWLIKTDANGNMQWNKTYGSEFGREEAHNIRQTSEGEYIVVGWTDYLGTTASFNIWLVKTDVSGNYQWDRVYGGDGWDWAFSVEQTSDGGYVIAGSKEVDSIDRDGWLLKTDEYGSLQWNKTMDETAWDQFHTIRQTYDGGYIIAGVVKYSIYEVWEEGWLVKTDANGNMQWNRTYGEPNTSATDWVVSVEQTSDAGYVAVGFTHRSTGAGYEDGWLFKTDSSGSMLWEKTFGGEYSDSGYSFAQTSDGGFIVAGYYTQDWFSLPDAWLVKLGPPPPPTHDVAITNIVLSKSVVGRGLSLNISVTAANQGDYSESFNITANANTTIIGETQMILNSTEETAVTFTWNTTGFALGNYTIWAYAEPVEGETYLDDNTFTEGTAQVSIVGDINADEVVDIFDLILVASAYGSTVGEPEYKPNSDINGDGIIDIFDLILVASHYGETAS